MQYWYLWVIGLIVLPIVAILPQLKNIHKVIDDKLKNPGEIAMLFLNPSTLVVSIIGLMGSFVCLVLFFTSIIFAVINYIKS
jgi:hypothetical protein